MHVDVVYRFTRLLRGAANRAYAFFGGLKHES